MYPSLISFKYLCMTYLLLTLFLRQVRVKYTDGQTAKRIPMKLLVKAFGNGGMKISVSKQMQGSIFDLNRANTDENGRAEFVINIARQVKMLQIEVYMENPIT